MRATVTYGRAQGALLQNKHPNIVALLFRASHSPRAASIDHFNPTLLAAASELRWLARAAFQPKYTQSAANSAVRIIA